MVRVFSQYFFMFENSLVQQIVTVVLIRDSIWRQGRREGVANRQMLPPGRRPGFRGAAVPSAVGPLAAGMPTGPQAPGRRPEATYAPL